MKFFKKNISKKYSSAELILHAFFIIFFGSLILYFSAYFISELLKLLICKVNTESGECRVWNEYDDNLFYFFIATAFSIAVWISSKLNKIKKLLISLFLILVSVFMLIISLEYTLINDIKLSHYRFGKKSQTLTLNEIKEITFISKKESNKSRRSNIYNEKCNSEVTIYPKDSSKQNIRISSSAREITLVLINDYKIKMTSGVINDKGCEL